MYPAIRNTLSTCGLVILTGPFCFLASAQYVDLEAERAAARAAGRAPASEAAAPTTPGDPYGAQPAQAYPATSYGANSAPAAPTESAAAIGSAPATVSPRPAAGSEVGNLVLQIQQLQQEVMRLNGRVEEQANELSTLKEQSLQRYMDLDKRISGGGQSTSPAAGGGGQPTSSAAGNAGAPPGDVAPTVEPAPIPSGAPQAGEEDAYRASYALVQGRQFEQAIPAFKQFLQRYPSGQYAANAHYWLGELYLVLNPPDLEAARQSFALLLSQYPDNSKAPDALYKLGKVQFLKGNREKAREYMDLVIKQYEGTNNAVVKLARDFIAQNY